MKGGKAMSITIGDVARVVIAIVLVIALFNGWG
jgi:hypothetical protein